MASTGLLSFYDRLRSRILRAVGRRGGRLGEKATQALLLVPDLFIFCARLALDPQVPATSRRLIGGALLYFLVPVDLLPEAFLGVGGFLDDLVLACGVLGSAFGDDLAPYAERYWNGPRPIAQVLGDVGRVGESLVGGRVQRRIDGLLASMRPRRPDADPPG